MDEGPLHSAAPDLVYWLVTFSAAYSVDLIDEVAIAAVDLLGINANNGA